MPEYGVISVGTGNTYGHPTQEVLSRLRDAGVTVYRTDLQEISSAPAAVRRSPSGLLDTAPQEEKAGSGEKGIYPQYKYHEVPRPRLLNAAEMGPENKRNLKGPERSCWTRDTVPAAGVSRRRQERGEL